MMSQVGRGDILSTRVDLLQPGYSLVTACLALGTLAAINTDIFEDQVALTERERGRGGQPNGLATAEWFATV